MFDLGKEIAKWRSDLAGSNDLPRKAIDELEGHLRDSIESRLDEQSDEEAFAGAVAQLGSNEQIVAEFRKSNGHIPFDYFFFWIGLVLLGWSLLHSIGQVYTGVIEGKRVWLGSVPSATLFLMDLLGGYGILRMLSLKYEGDAFLRAYRYCSKTLVYAVGFCFLAIGALWIFRGGSGIPNYEAKGLAVFGLNAVLLTTCVFVFRAKLNSVQLGQICVGLSAIIIAFPYVTKLKEHPASEIMPTVVGLHVLLLLLPLFFSKTEAKPEEATVV